MDAMSFVLNTIGIFQSMLVYTVNNVLLSCSIISIAFGPARIWLEWEDIAVGRNRVQRRDRHARAMSLQLRNYFPSKIKRTIMFQLMGELPLLCR